MTEKRKYRNKPVYWDTEKRVTVSRAKAEAKKTYGQFRYPKNVLRFASTLEFNVYLELCRMYGSDNIHCQYPVLIANPGYLYPKGKTWRVDFAIAAVKDSDKITYFVEAKGLWLPEFTYTLSLLEQHDRNKFSRLRIIMGTEIPTERRVVASLYDSAFRNNLLVYEDLKQLRHLP